MSGDRANILAGIELGIGKEGCGVSCEDADIFKDQEGWKLMLCGFLEPWFLGKTVDEAKAKIREYASQGFGLA